MLNSPRLLNLPLLLCANKQDSPNSLSVAEIRESFDAWQRAGAAALSNEESQSTAGVGSQGKGKGKERQGSGEVEHWDDGGARDERVASLDVMGISALEG